MYYQAALSQTRTRRQIRRNRNLTGRVTTRTLGPVSSTLLLVIMIAVLSMLYLTQITKTSVYGYQINDLSERQAGLLEEQQELQVEAARLKSVARIENSGVAAGLEPENNVTYDRSSQ